MGMVKDELTGIEYDSQQGPTPEQKRAMEEARVRQQKEAYNKQVTTDEKGNTRSQADADREAGKRKNAIYKAKKEQEEWERRSTGGITGGATGRHRQLALPEGQIDDINEQLEEQGFEPLTKEEEETVKDTHTRKISGKDEHGNTVLDPKYFYDGEAAGKKAQESVKELGSFDMPKASNLGNYFAIGDAAKQEGIMPKSIWQAWKNGEFNTATDPDGKKTRNYLMLNSAMTAIGNAARGFQGGLQHTGAEHKDTLWQKRQEENMARQTERENVQNDLLKQAETDTKLSDIWGSFTPEQKQGVLDAKNAFATGNLSKAEDLMRNSMGDQRYSEWLQYFENLKAQLSVNADARAQEQLRYMETMGPIGLLLGAAGKLIPGL